MTSRALACLGLVAVPASYLLEFGELRAFVAACRACTTTSILERGGGFSSFPLVPPDLVLQVPIAKSVTLGRKEEHNS